MNIVILDAYVNNPGDLSWDPLFEFGDVAIYDRTTPEEIPARVKNAHIAVTNKIMWDAAALAAAPELELIALTSTGFNTVDLDIARERGITVCNVPAYSTPDVAQMTFALMLELALRTGDHSRDVLDGGWTNSVDFTYWNHPLVELSGKTLGIVGMGNIGAAVARIAEAFGMRVLFYNRTPKPQLEHATCTQVSLEELLASSDVVSLHVPASAETNGLINAQRIALMKDGAFVINTARGTLVEEEAMAEALRSGKLAGFGADVVSVEPMLPSNPLLSVRDKNVVITPHIAWATRDARSRLLNTVFANVGAYLRGEPQNVVS